MFHIILAVETCLKVANILEVMGSIVFPTTKKIIRRCEINHRDF